MGIKQSLKNIAADLEQERQAYGKEMLPLYRQQLGDISGYTGRMRGMATDESQRGYSPETINAMRAAATGALTGARRSTMQDVNRNIAASGMGNTGMGIRMAANMGRDFSKQQREANRDVDLAQAEAKRADLWNALNAEQSGYGLGLQGAGQMGDVYTNRANMLSAKVQPLLGAHNASFWGNFNDIAGGLKDLLGKGGALAGPFG